MQRVYPLGSRATSVGLEGLERTSDVRLRRGETLTLTLDTRVQAEVERVLQDAVSRTEAEFTSAVVMDIASGGLRAMAPMPSFDFNRWRDAPAVRWRNRAALNEYEPGSVIKALTVAALLNEGRTNPDRISDTPMSRRYAENHHR